MTRNYRQPPVEGGFQLIASKKKKKEREKEQERENARAPWKAGGCVQGPGSRQREVGTAD